MCDQHAHRRGNDQKEGQDDRHPKIEQDSAPEDRAVGRKDRQAKKKHHPGRVQNRGDQTRVVEGAGGNRGGEEQIQIAREKKSRQGRYEVAEKEHGQKSQQNDQQQLVSQAWSQIIDRLKIEQDATDDVIDAAPEGGRQTDEQPAAAPCLAAA